MLVIRLQRVGKKHQPSYRLVVAERRSKMAAPPVEFLGHYNPLTKKGEFKAERIKYWLGQGAKPSVTVHNLLVSHKVIEGAKIQVKIAHKVKGPSSGEVKNKAVVESSGADEGSNSEVFSSETEKKEASQEEGVEVGKE